MKKLKMHSPDITQENIQKIREMFPDCVTEATDGEGNVRLGVDFDQLRQELSLEAQEEGERYCLSWPGKLEARALSNSPVNKALRPSLKKSLNFDGTKNLFLEGDNLEVLKLLRQVYLGQIKLIYIDPPYNTGSDLIYNDKFREGTDSFLLDSGQTSETGQKLVANSQTAGRFHSNWLSMMFPRLRLARQLLKDDGIILISIDDNERPNLQKLCEEIFGGDNFLGCFVWKRRSGAMDAVSNLSEDHEYVLAYTKGEASLKGVARTFEKYTNPDNDERGDWISDNLSAGKPGGDTFYAITDPKTGNEFWPPKGRYWPYSRKTMATKISEGRVLFPKTAEGTPMLKRFASEALKPSIPVSSWIEKHGTKVGQSTITTPMNSGATKALKEMFDGKLFSFPKPVELIQALVAQTTEADSLILDFFAGSGTTAHAVMAQNAKDGGTRAFIMVQWPEQIDAKSDAGKAGYETIADLAQERIRRAGKQLALLPDSSRKQPLDVGFRTLITDSSNMKEVFYAPDATKQIDLLSAADNIKPDREPLDLLFQVLVDWGVDLSLEVKSEQIEGLTTFFVDQTALAACFEDKVSEKLIYKLAERKPLRAVFRDSGFSTDSDRINVEQIFRQLSPGTEVKVI